MPSAPNPSTRERVLTHVYAEAGRRRKRRLGVAGVAALVTVAAIAVSVASSGANRRQLRVVAEPARSSLVVPEIRALPYTGPSAGGDCAFGPGPVPQLLPWTTAVVEATVRRIGPPTGPTTTVTSPLLTEGDIHQGDVVSASIDRTVAGRPTFDGQAFERRYLIVDGRTGSVPPGPQVGDRMLLFIGGPSYDDLDRYSVFASSVIRGGVLADDAAGEPCYPLGGSQGRTLDAVESDVVAAQSTVGRAVRTKDDILAEREALAASDATSTTAPVLSSPSPCPEGPVDGAALRSLRSPESEATVAVGNTASWWHPDALGGFIARASVDAVRAARLPGIDELGYAGGSEVFVSVTVIKVAKPDVRQLIVYIESPLGRPVSQEIRLPDYCWRD